MIGDTLNHTRLVKSISVEKAWIIFYFPKEKFCKWASLQIWAFLPKIHQPYPELKTAFVIEQQANTIVSQQKWDVSPTYPSSRPSWSSGWLATFLLTRSSFKQRQPLFIYLVQSLSIQLFIVLSPAGKETC